MTSAFDPRLITADRLLALAGDTPIVTGPGRQLKGRLTLDCGLCMQPIARLTDKTSSPYRFSAGQLLQDVLRHLVVAHDMPLSGAAAEIAGEMKKEREAETDGG